MVTIIIGKSTKPKLYKAWHIIANYFIVNVLSKRI